MQWALHLLVAPCVLPLPVWHALSKCEAREKNAFIYWVNVLKTLKADIVTHADGNGASCADGGG